MTTTVTGHGEAREPLIAKRFAVMRSIEADPNATILPTWAQQLAIGGYREQGWSAFDQREGGKVVATGAWGDELFLLNDGSFGCTAYPLGYPGTAHVAAPRE